MDSNKYHIQVIAEDKYTFSDYKKILQLEHDRIIRLIDSFDHIKSGDKYLVPVTQEPKYTFSIPQGSSQSSVNYYQRYGSSIAYYGVPARPSPDPQPRQSVTPQPQAAYPLSSNAISRNPADDKIENILGRYEKIICPSDAFWAEYHFLLHSDASQSQNRRYTWQEKPQSIGAKLATPCYKYSPYTFQSWLYYRAPIENTPPLIILDTHQWDWLLSNGLDQIPATSELLVLSNDKNRPIKFGQDLGINLRSNHQIYKVDIIKALSTTYKDITQIEQTQKWPKISVVVCSYNQGEYLSSCLDSILEQGYPNLELIVVDGNSTDQSIDVLKTYSDRIDHLICEDDEGQSDALNKGFDTSTGDVMTWVCSDDGLEPKSLFRVGQEFIGNDIDMVAGACRKVGVDGEDISCHHTFLPFNEKLSLSFGDMISFGYTWLKGFYFIQPELFWSRRIWEKSGSYIKNHMFFAMDYELFLRFALAGGTILHIQSPLAFALVHENQKTAHTGQNLPTVIRMIEEFQEMISIIESDNNKHE